MEFQFFTDDNNLFCSSQCWNHPYAGWSGLLQPITPYGNFGINQCPVPNYGLLGPRFRGYTPIGPLGLGLAGGLTGGLAGVGLGGIGYPLGY